MRKGVACNPLATEDESDEALAAMVCTRSRYVVDRAWKILMRRTLKAPVLQYLCTNAKTKAQRDAAISRLVNLRGVPRVMIDEALKHATSGTRARLQFWLDRG